MPWTIRPTASAGTPASSAPWRSPLMNPTDGSAGVDSTFVSQARPLPISTIVTSVNVPPTSMPTLYSAMSATS